MPNFNVWSHESLVKFAEEANAKMKEQHEYNQQLQCKLKDEEEAYKKLFNVYTESHGISQPKTS